MKRKILALATILVLLLCNYAFAYATITDSDLSGGATLSSSNTTMIDSDTEISSEYNARSKAIDYSKVEVCNYGTTEKKTSIGNTPVNSTSSNIKGFLTSVELSGDDFLNYTIRLEKGTTSLENIATIYYKKALTFNKKTYNIKLDIKGIRRGTDNNNSSTYDDVYFRIGRRDHSDSSLYDGSSYTKAFLPNIGVNPNPATSIFVDFDYTVVDDDNQVVPISAVFQITDIDLHQGIYLYAAKNSFSSVSKTKTYVQALHDNIKYKIEGNGLLLYDTQGTDIPDNLYAHVYQLIKDESTIASTFAWKDHGAYSGIRLSDEINVYKPGEDDPTPTPLIKYKVTFYPKGGTPQPAQQTKSEGEKATKPANVTKPGYTTDNKWYLYDKDTDTIGEEYDFDTPVNSDIDLAAKWTPIQYNIQYHLNDEDGPQATNPNTQTTFTLDDDDITVSPATRTGYDFDGWDMKNGDTVADNIGSISTTYDGIKDYIDDNNTIHLYANWKEKSDVPYTIEHYLEDDNGDITIDNKKYKLNTEATEEKTGTINEDVTATPKTFQGYKENTTVSERVPSGKIAADGSLVLKLFYDKEKYTVTFDPQGGEPDPDDQIVEYEEKATEPNDPTKDGYTFDYWYYIDDNGNKVKYDFNEPVTRNIDLIAQWTPVEAPAQEEEQKPAEKKDQTVADKVIPNTGEFAKVAKVGLFSLAVLVLAIFGIRYFRIKKMMK